MDIINIVICAAEMVNLLQIYLMALFGPRFIIRYNIYHFVVLNFDLWSIGKSINLAINLQQIQI